MRKIALSIRRTDLDDSSPEAALANAEVRYRHRELETPRTGASRIQEKNSVSSVGAGAVGVAADHGVEPLGSRVDIQLLQVVEDVDAEAAYFDRAGDGEPTGPGAPVVVAANGDYRCDPAELLEHFWPAYVPRVEDELAPLQRREHLGAEQVVGVRDHPDKDTQRFNRARTSSAVFFSCG